jgi:GT2 family glycosyltransferase
LISRYLSVIFLCVSVPLWFKLFEHTSMTTANISITSPAGLVSIIIPCCGMLEYTKLCIPSVRRHTREPFELIFLDIGSLDGTAEYLAGLREGLASRMRVEVSRAATDLDIGDACKNALKLAYGEFVCLLNNDTVVTPGWLDSLVNLANNSDAHGLVGPMSNYAAAPQLVETVPYRVGPKKGARPGDPLVDVQAVEMFAQEFNAQHRARWIQVLPPYALGGFCLLIRRAVLDKIGKNLDEWTDLSLFDTDIVSAKAREAGFTLCCCRDRFVHHFGTRTFAHGAPQAPQGPV